jgi:hypothetical protein
MLARYLGPSDHYTVPGEGTFNRGGEPREISRGALQQARQNGHQFEIVKEGNTDAGYPGSGGRHPRGTR